MPCYDPLAERDSAEERIQKIQELTRMLCGLCTEITGRGHSLRSIPGLPEWWAEHQEEDRIRIEKENKRKEQERKADEQVLNALAKKLGKKVV